jgi:molybdenum cofactor synthesis domain-containing protein
VVAKAESGIVSNALVVVASRRASQGIYEDTSGPILAQGLRDLGFSVELKVVDDGEPVAKALSEAVNRNLELIITSGGTGLTPRDLTPEMTSRFIDKPLPGIAEALRFDGITQGISMAPLSRAIAGISKNTLIINVAGSAGAARDAVRVLSPILLHAIDQMKGGDH